jgi:RNA polymerase sigma-70 factor (ECF subfamily)
VSRSASPTKRQNDLVPLEEERAVVQRLQRGDHTAFATLYGWYGDPIFRSVILPRLPIRELAEDCLRDTFRVGLEKIDSFRLERHSIFFWLRRIAINKAIDIHRRHRRDQDLAAAIAAEPAAQISGQRPDKPDRGLEVADTKREVELSLGRLNTRYATALRLRLLEERTREACAEALDVTVGNFDVILHRACKAFRKVYPP